MERRLKVMQWILGAILFIFVAGPIWVAIQLPSINTVAIEGLVVEGEDRLCPGEALVVRYKLHVKGRGVLLRDWTLWNLEPPKTLIFSNSLRFIVEGPVEQDLTQTWHVPHSYWNPETDKTEPIPPGRYRRDLAISSPSRSGIIAIAGVDFEIRGDCP